MFAGCTDHRNTIAGDRHAHFSHVSHAALAHGHVTSQTFTNSLVYAAGTHPDEVRRVMSHLVHRVMGHMTVHRPVARIVRNEFNGPRFAYRDQNRVTWRLRWFWDRKAIHLDDLPVISV